MANIQITSLRREFGNRPVVNDISFGVEPGEVLGFLGPNGAGKSTTMKMITGFLDPTEGTVVVGGHDVREFPLKVKRQIGYLPEGAPCYGEMTVGAFLRFIAEIRGYSGNDRKRRIDCVVEQVHLQQVFNQTIETLSKGYKRRVGLAQAMLHDPPVLIMDEPTDGLDPNQKNEVRTLIRQMSKSKAIIISTHILEEVDAVCSRVIMIVQGRLIFDGTPQEFTANSKHGDIDAAFRGLSQEYYRAQGGEEVFL